MSGASRRRRPAWAAAVLSAVVVPGLTLVAAPAARATPGPYDVHDLGLLSGGTTSIGTAINATGQVGGFGDVASGHLIGFRTGPLLPINPATDTLGTLGGLESRVFGINSSGTVTGFSYLAVGSGFDVFHAFLNTAGPLSTANDMGTLGGTTSIGRAINDKGQVTGQSDTVGNLANHAFLTPPGATTITPADDLGTLGGNFSEGDALNNKGQVTGQAETPSFELHAFRTAPDAAINPSTDDLGTLGGTLSFGRGINNSGQVCGSSTTAGDAATHAFLTTATGAIDAASDLGTLGGTLSQANGVNDAGVVVGFSTTASGAQHAFVDVSHMMIDLNTLIPSNSGWTLINARAINNAGDITGTGTFQGTNRAFLLTPAGVVPIPLPAAVYGGLAVLGTIAWRQRRTAAAAAPLQGT